MTEPTKEELQQAVDRVWYALGPAIKCPCGNPPDYSGCLEGLAHEARTALDAVKPYVSKQARQDYGKK